jgi:hypothetical protein
VGISYVDMCVKRVEIAGTSEGTSWGTARDKSKTDERGNSYTHQFHRIARMSNANQPQAQP